MTVAHTTHRTNRFNSISTLFLYIYHPIFIILIELKNQTKNYGSSFLVLRHDWRQGTHCNATQLLWLQINYRVHRRWRKHTFPSLITRCLRIAIVSAKPWPWVNFNILFCQLFWDIEGANLFINISEKNLFTSFRAEFWIIYATKLLMKLIRAH